MTLDGILPTTPQLGLHEAPRSPGKILAIAESLVNHCVHKEGATVYSCSTSERMAMRVKKIVLQRLSDTGYGSWILWIGDKGIAIRDPKKPNARPSVMVFAYG